MIDPIFKIEDFSSFIQFLAGIYLVFLYDKVLKSNPLQTQVESITNLLSSLVNDNQAYFNQENEERVKEFDEKRKKKWDLQFYSLKRISFLSFLFCMCMLFYVGIEDWMLSKHMEQSLIFPSLVILIYELYLFFTTDFLHWTKTCRFAGLLFIILFLYVVIYILFFYDCCIFSPWSATSIYLLVMSTMMFGGIAYGLNLVYRFIKFFKIQRDIKNLARKINTLFEVRFRIKDVSDIGSKTTNRLLKKSLETGQPVQECMDQFITDEFQAYFDKIISK